MLNHFFSQRQGWDLAEELTEEGIKTGKPKLLARPLPNGGTGFGFELADTTKNRERFEAQFNRPFEEGQSLTNAQEVPIVLDELGLEDRKSVVKGKSVSVRVELGGRGLIKKKQQKRHQ